MILRFLGTSAGELYPGLWCRCRHCQSARQGEQRQRRLSAVLYVEPALADAHIIQESTGVLIDFPSEIASQAIQYRVELPELQYLLVTHSHGDHWFPYLMRWRMRPPECCRTGEAAPVGIGGPRFTELPDLHIWGNAAVGAALHRELGQDLAPYAVVFHPTRPRMEFTVGALTVNAVLANHDVGREEALHYILTDGRHTILYGLDGDTFLPETREALRSFQFDLVILESTYGLGDGTNHRNFARLQEEAHWLRAENLITPDGIVVATHFSPHHCPPHQETSDILHRHNIVAAWDGMEIRL
jgi:phosphoribosyl 1,2-cyclic phosphate phosphodiesterase